MTFVSLHNVAAFYACDYDQALKDRFTLFQVCLKTTGAHIAAKKFFLLFILPIKDPFPMHFQFKWWGTNTAVVPFNWIICYRQKTEPIWKTPQDSQPVEAFSHVPNLCLSVTRYNIMFPSVIHNLHAELCHRNCGKYQRSSGIGRITECSSQWKK